MTTKRTRRFARGRWICSIKRKNWQIIHSSGSWFLLSMKNKIYTSGRGVYGYRARSGTYLRLFPYYTHRTEQERRWSWICSTRVSQYPTRNECISINSCFRRIQRSINGSTSPDQLYFIDSVENQTWIRWSIRSDGWSPRISWTRGGYSALMSFKWPILRVQLSWKKCFIICFEWVLLWSLPRIDCLKVSCMRLVI